MDWRNRFLERCGPGLFAGIAWPDWITVLRDKSLESDPEFLPRRFCITMQAIKNSLYRTREQRRFKTALESVVIQPPLFILGHWRSGTTHLHNLLAQDSRFAFPNSFETSFPHSFLTRETSLEPRLLSWFIPRTRPMDDVQLTLASPQEDEFALCASSLKSPCLAWAFPRQGERFEKYLSFKGVGEQEHRVWRESLLCFLKKVQYCHQRPLILKSPPHTARVGLLLGLFPEARFVHIHRDPYRVFLSSKRTFQILYRWHGLQRPNLADLDNYILRQYARMYDTFLEQRALIPKGHYHEVQFEDLERDPVGEMSKLYHALDLPDFPTVEPVLRRYLGTLNGYRKNTLPELDPVLKARVGDEWKPYFSEWGYAC